MGRHVHEETSVGLRSPPEGLEEPIGMLSSTERFCQVVGWPSVATSEAPLRLNVVLLMSLRKP